MKLRARARQALLLAVGLALGMGVFRGENFLERLLVDLRFFIAAHARAHESISDRVAVVLMDSGSESRLAVPYGTKWRQFHPDIIRRLNEAGASLVVFDALFFDQDPVLDLPLAAAIRAAGNVMAGEDGSVLTAPGLRDSFLAIGDLRIPQMGGVPRFLHAGPTARGLPPLSVLAVREHVRRSGAALPPVPDRNRLWLDFREPLSYFPAFSYEEVLHPRDSRVQDLSTGSAVPLSVFSGRIVFIGRDEGGSSRADRFPFPSTLGRLSPGVYGHAYAAEMLLHGTRIARSPGWVDAICVLALLALLLAVLEIRSRPLRIALLVFFPVGSFAACQVLLSGPGIWIGCAPLLVAFLSALALDRALTRMSLSSSLSRAMGFDPRLIDTFRRESARQGGSLRRDVAVLIADVRDYTRYVTRTSPATVSLVMSEYMGAMERCITNRGGYINKYVGDEIVAVFGFPLDAAGREERAVQAAIDMLDELARLTADWKDRGLSSIERIGIGIDTGAVSFAEVGGRTRSQLDIIGDCINGASRIEHLTKEIGRVLLVSEEVFRGLESCDSLAGLFELATTAAVRGQGERRVFALVR
jgi:class 3 adenylate cyclase/CHASE2 domain-containing sensor protein